MKKRLPALLLAIMLLLEAVPAGSAFAMEAETGTEIAQQEVIPEETPLPEEEMIPEETPLPEEEIIPEETPLPEEEMIPEETPLPEEEIIPEETPLPEEEMIPEETPLPEEEMIPEETPLLEEEIIPEETPAPEEQAEVIEYVCEDYSGPSDEELFDAYAEREFNKALGIYSYTKPPRPDGATTFSTNVLKEGTLDKSIYDGLKAELVKVSNGESASSEITVYPVGTWSASELGVSSIFTSSGSLTTAANEAINNKLIRIYRCLLADCPLELYWHDKTRGVSMGKVWYKSGDEIGLSSAGYDFVVSKDYSVTNQHKTFNVDTAKTSAAKNAVAYAQQIVAENASKGNAEKLRSYLETICSLTSYAREGLDDMNDGVIDGTMDHWQMVYVFDRDSSTKVVCEGYSKAFQYLCDLSYFTDGIECHTVVGIMSSSSGGGGHMWNVVRMEDGKNYLVDVTNCDSGMTGNPDMLFLASAASSSSANKIHTFRAGSTVKYEYDEEQKDFFCEGYLPISTTPYIAPVIEPSADLMALYVGNGGWEGESFDPETLEYQTEFLMNRNGETCRIKAVPKDKDAVIQISAKGETFTGAEADIPLMIGDNAVEIKVTRGELQKVYKLTITAKIRTGSLTVAVDEDVPVETVVVTLESDLDFYEGQSFLLQPGDGFTLDSVPYSIDVTITSSESGPVQLYAYGEGLYGDLTKEGNPYSFEVNGDSSIHITSKYACAKAPAFIDAAWDVNRASTAVVSVPTVKNPSGEGNCGVALTVRDDKGEVVAHHDSSEADENGNVRFELTELDNTRSYTLRAYYWELVEQYGHNAGGDAQYAVEVLDAMEEIHLIPQSGHIVLQPGETREITFDFNGLSGTAVEYAGCDVEGLVSVAMEDNKAVVTAAQDSQGTAWLTFRGLEKTVDVRGEGAPQYVYATVRVDVHSQEETNSLHIDAASVSLNVYDDSYVDVPVYRMDAYPKINFAEFMDEDAAQALKIETLNDRTLRIIPKTKEEMGEACANMTWAQWGKAVQGTYVSGIRVDYGDGILKESAETITIKLTAKAPSVKAAAVKLNSFYQGPEMPLEFTTKDGTVEKVLVDEAKATAKAPACPDWLILNDDMTVTLDNSGLVNNKASGKLNLEVWLEGWRAPAQVAVSVSAAYTAPKLKLSKTSVSLPAYSTDFAGYTLELLSSDKTKPLFKDTGVTDIRVATAADLNTMSAKDKTAYAASTAYKAGAVNDEGEFTLLSNGRMAAGKVLIIATIDDVASQTVTFPVTVKLLSSATLKASKTKVALNTAMGIEEGVRDEQTVTLTSSAAGYRINESTTRITVKDSDGWPATSELGIEQQGDTLIFRCTENTISGENYKVTVSVAGIEKPVTITVTPKAAVPKLKLSKTSITLNRALGAGMDRQLVTVSAAGYDVDGLWENTEATAADGKDDMLELITEDPGIIGISTNENTQPGTYKVNVVHTMPGGQKTSAVITVKVADKLPSVKLSSTSVTMYQSTRYNDAVVTVSGLNGYNVEGCHLAVTDSKGKPVADNCVIAQYGESGIRLSLGDNAKAGQTYKVSAVFELEQGIKTKPVAVSVKVVERITVSASAKGNMDIARPYTTKTDLAIKYTGWTPALYDGDGAPLFSWEVYAMEGKQPIGTDKGALDENGRVAGGSYDGDVGMELADDWFVNAGRDYGLSLMLNTAENSPWAKGLVNPKYTYTCKMSLTLRGDDGGPVEVIEFKPVKITIKQSGAKFAADKKEVSLSKYDGYGRQLFTIACTDKDKANVADIARVELVSGALADKLELRHMSGSYAICWKNNSPSAAKSGTVKLNVFLEGNGTDKPNGTVSIKVNIK